MNTLGWLRFFRAPRLYIFGLCIISQFSCRAPEQPQFDTIDKNRFRAIAVSRLIASDQKAAVCDANILNNQMILDKSSCCDAEFSGGADKDNEYKDKKRFIHVIVNYQCSSISQKYSGTADFYFTRDGQEVESFISPPR